MSEPSVDNLSLPDIKESVGIFKQVILLYEKYPTMTAVFVAMGVGYLIHRFRMETKEEETRRKLAEQEMMFNRLLHGQEMKTVEEAKEKAIEAIEQAKVKEMEAVEEKAANKIKVDRINMKLALAQSLLDEEDKRRFETITNFIRDLQGQERGEAPLEQLD